jgi:hypothetical protein
MRDNFGEGHEQELLSTWEEAKSRSMLSILIRGVALIRLQEGEVYTVTRDRRSIQPIYESNSPVMSEYCNDDLSMEDGIRNVDLPPLDDMTDAHDMIERWLEDTSGAKASDLRAFKNGQLGFDAFFTKYWNEDGSWKASSVDDLATPFSALKMDTSEGTRYSSVSEPGSAGQA